MLLIFSDQPSSSAAAAAARSGCISEDKLNNRTDKFRRKHWDNLAISKNPVLEPGALDCAQFAKQSHRGDMNKRSLSPWTYRYVTQRAATETVRGQKRSENHGAVPRAIKPGLHYSREAKTVFQISESFYSICENAKRKIHMLFCYMQTTLDQGPD